MDKISPATRSRNMSLIRSKNTKPELLLRKALFKKGLRFRIHYNLPGKPDIVFPKQKIVIFVHGCFWHSHGCKLDHIPKSNSEFWGHKIIRNKERDIKIAEELKKNGWKIIIVWECKVISRLEKAIQKIMAEIYKPM